MKRRTFIQSLAAALSMPAAGSLTVTSASASVPTAAAAVPTKARFWAIYMSSLHGECTPQTLHNLLHIPKVDAKRYVSQLIADGVIKPNPLLQKTAAELVKSKNENLLEKVKKRSEMKAKAKTEPLDVHKVKGTLENENQQKVDANDTDLELDDNIENERDEKNTLDQFGPDKTANSKLH